MLCDEALEKLPKYPWFGEILGRISSAPKFVLDHPFAQAADQLSNDTSGLMKLLPMCRLPYPEIWVEVSHRDRLSFVNGAPPRVHEKQPKRVGWLVSQIHETRWKAHLFWSFADGNVQSSALAVDVPLAGENIGIADADWLARVPLHVRPLLRGLTRDDWKGEAAFLHAILALLNSKNCTEIATESMQRKNKGRAKHNKAPLFDYHVLKVHSRIRRHTGEFKGAAGFANLRAHFVRGHFKVRKTGIFFWHPFVRGSLRNGFADKDYRLAS